MQKFKGLGTLFAAIVAVYILAPTFFGFEAKKNALLEAGEPLPWYQKVLYGDEINLGLDLQGGIYIEMEVDIEEAMDHHINFLLTDIRNYVFRDDLEGLTAQRVKKDVARIEVKQDQVGALQGSLVNIFGPDQFEISNDEHEVFYAIKANPEPELKKITRKLATLNSDPTKVPHAVLSGDGRYVGVAYKSQTEKGQILNVLADLVDGDQIKQETPKDISYLQFTDAQLARLKKDVIEQAAKSVRNRIDRFGVAEASVSRQGSDRLVIELPGAKDPDEIISIVKRTGKLEFRIVDSTQSPDALRAKIEAKKTELKLKTAYEGKDLVAINAALRADIPQNSEIFVSLTRDPESKKVTGYTPYLLAKTADVTGDMLDNASVQSQNGMPYVSMSFDKNGAKKFGDVTSANVGKQLAIVLDNIIMSAPNIEGPIRGGEAMIRLGYGSYQDLYKEAQDLTLILKEGALPASLQVASKNIIGPSLGQDSINAGVKSILISAAGVLIFMLLYYRLGGLIADISLILNVGLIFAILTLMGASLTLPGMAGIVLTLGMAVDANVIIFERMREEKLVHEDVFAIIDSAYRSAISAIVDGNVTTFIAAVFLFDQGTGPIKGFATTLMIGIATTLFTSIVVSRFLYDWAASQFRLKGVGF